MDLLQRTLLAVTLFGSTAACAQNSLPVPTNIQATYYKGTRTTSGAPGKNYWQNRADYTLSINFNPLTRVLDGIDEIDYINNSPDTLKQIWFKLYPNMYKKGGSASHVDQTGG